MQFIDIFKNKPDRSTQIEDAGQITSARAQEDGASILEFVRYLSRRHLEFDAPEGEGEIGVIDVDN